MKLGRWLEGARDCCYKGLPTVAGEFRDDPETWLRRRG